MNVAGVKKHLLTSVFLCAIFIFLLAGKASALSLNVVGPNGEAVTNFRWMMEEDATYHVNPGQIDPDTLAVSFHKSYMPPAASGDNTTSGSIPTEAGKHYYISVLPGSDYSISGAAVSPGQTSVTVTVNKLPLPTAQISIFVFEDTKPINNAPDLPAEAGIEGFTIILAEAGGRYGMSGGQVTNDAFGNPLGTTYNPDGSVLALGSGIIKTGINGEALIKNLPPGKYGIIAVPPSGQGWVQTSTIEGTPTIDAWVKANEPQFFTEFGPPGWHVAIGFLKPMNDTTVLTGGSTVTGQVVNLHLSKPPIFNFYNGEPLGHTTPWVGLNDLAGGAGRGVFAKRTNPDGTFSIPNVPPGNYQLVVWDDNLDLIIALLGVNVTQSSGNLVLGDVPVFQWFTRLETKVFYDWDLDGFKDCVTPECNDITRDDFGLADIPVNLRFRDGSLYQSIPTDMTGYAPFDEVFPFFNWLVAEVDYTRLKATGATIVVDNGGPINPDQGWTYPSNNVLTPQPQFEADGVTPIVNPNTGNNLSKTETGPVLLEAFQGFIGQTSRIEFGKAAYGPGENGGISGMVNYATTRAENDPKNAAAEPWEPGIPRVQVNLYRDSNGDKAIDDVTNDGVITLADVDNYPFGWAAGGLKGAEDIDRNVNNVFDLGDALQFTTTDGWDDNTPTGCQGTPFISHGVAKDCYDGLRVFNQVRPGVFDGGFAFMNIPSGIYIVEAMPPISNNGAAYQTVKEEDKNVDFGDSYFPALLAPECVNYDENNGQGHYVPDFLTLFPGVPSFYARQYRPLCDRKQVVLSNGANAAVNFFMFTEVPIAGHISGFILDDTANEFDPTSPQFGEKFAPPWLPISIKDWTGKELSRTYSDEWGVYNALVPSTYTTNIPSPSGVSPSMITVCLNDPGPIPDPGVPGGFITDPFFSRQYSQFCYTLQYMPGTTTYLDTPVIPVAAFAGPGQYPLDCELPDGTPKIYSVNGPQGIGPYAPNLQPLEQVTIVSEGFVDVPNPLYDGPNGINPKTVSRDYGFGSVQGNVRIGSTNLQIIAWTPDSITAAIPAGTATGNLMMTRGDNNESTKSGVTFTIGPITGTVRAVAPGSSIQQTIDIAQPGDLVLVPPGRYDELVIMWKPIQLQGWGSASTMINAVKTPAEKLTAWRNKVASLVSTGSVTMLPSQDPTLTTEEGSAITVLARDAAQANGGFGPDPNARIDGFTLTGADNGNGVFVNAYARYLEVSNNRVINNQGFYGGGVRLGHPYLTAETPGGAVYAGSFNDNINIHNNHITQNSGLGAAGGGISLFAGSDSYRVMRNFVCGNFSLGEGAGIGHLGLSPGGQISNNFILFNQSFNQGQTVSGGGILISGSDPLVLNGLTPGSGSVQILSNTIQGNLAGAGDGGGIRTNLTNGADVAANPTLPNTWYSVDIANNFIVNNVAGLAGGGISMQDSARINIIHNTIANNDSTATAGEAFSPGLPNNSTPQPAGVVSRAHTDALNAAIGVLRYRDFSNPTLIDNIIWHNRSFSFIADTTQLPPFYGLTPNVPAEPPVFWDLQVMGTLTPRTLNPTYSLLTDTAGYSPTNISAPPSFVFEYYNGNRNAVIQPEITTAIQAMPAFDEGGNFIDVRFGPLSFTGDYHIQTGSPAVDSGLTLNAVRRDIDNEIRPNGTNSDIGADEQYQ